MAGTIKWVQTDLSVFDASSSRSIHTTKKTVCDLKLFTDYLVEIKDEKRPPEQIEEDVLISHMKEFFSGIKKRSDGSEFQPSSLWGIFNSLKRYLKDKEYKVTQDTFTPVFDLLKVKSKHLRSKGLVNAPRRSDYILNHEVKQLFDERLAGTHNPRALNNSMALVCSFLGFRGGNELYDRCLGDFTVVSIEGTRYLTVSKDSLPQRRGIFKSGKLTDRLADCRFGLPKLAETRTNTCPVLTYEVITVHRPAEFRSAGSPLFLRPNSNDTHTVLGPHRPWFYKTRLGRKQISMIVSKMCRSSEVLDFAGRRITNASVGKSITHSLCEDVQETPYNTHRTQKPMKTYVESRPRCRDFPDSAIQRATNSLYGEESRDMTSRVRLERSTMKRRREEDSLEREPEECIYTICDCSNKDVATSDSKQGSSKMDMKVGVEIGVQVNLYEEAIWSLPPEFKLKDHANSYSDYELLDEIFEMEKATIANDKLKSENNTMIAILESSLCQRKALKIELDKREEEIKNYRLTILKNRNCSRDGLK